MVRVPGSSGDSQGFHCESNENTTKIKLNRGLRRYTHRQSAGSSSTDDKEGGSTVDLEGKPQPPPPTSFGSPCAKLKASDSNVEDGKKVQSWTANKLELTFYQRELTSLLIVNLVMKIVRSKMISALQDPVTAPTETSSKLEYVKSLMLIMKEVDIEPGIFDANALLDAELASIQNATLSPHKILSPLIGSSALKR
ncbi:Hypothetical protein PHPALM_18217 [Phytophthora palmivora]|uniref:Uncharacterized protein n=1 Tax=Phytophthora palmivora TaxID=4796 RepID=A0A2P4XKC4_9STRA|nr:Hypothetical protein PHPALM_18217 [Phytophthora palmivora]